MRSSAGAGPIGSRTGSWVVTANGGAWVGDYWEKNQWGGCRSCVLYEQREAGECGSDYGSHHCQVVEGQEETRECPELAERIRFEGVQLYGVNKPPPKRMGWRRG